MQTRLHGKNKGPMQRVMWKPHHTLQIKKEQCCHPLFYRFSFWNIESYIKFCFPNESSPINPSYQTEPWILPCCRDKFWLIPVISLLKALSLWLPDSFWEAMAISQKDNILKKWEFGLDTAFSMQCELHSNILLPVWDFSLVRYSKNRKH